MQYLTLDHNVNDWAHWGRHYPTIVQQHDIIEARVQRIMQEYDFLVLVERIDESLVAMQLLLGLPLSDTLFTSAKVGGGYAHTPKRGDHHCTPIQKAFQSPAVKDYLSSDVWYAHNYGDYALHAAANRSLDLTIERLGKERFAVALQKFRDAEALVMERCDSETFFPCSVDGVEQLELSKSSCYRVDEGCGYPCIDNLVQEQGWSQIEE